MKIVKKGWGQERIWADQKTHCGKFLDFEAGHQFSMHFHAIKDESWIVLHGIFKIRWINTEDASMHETVLKEGDTWHNPPLLPHQLICIEKGTIVEVSTQDSPTDNYRVLPGDSQ